VHLVTDSVIEWLLEYEVGGSDMPGTPGTALEGSLGISQLVGGLVLQSFTLMVRGRPSIAAIRLFMST
jgi:hypothetical protein